MWSVIAKFDSSDTKTQVVNSNKVMKETPNID